jgi:hypothetical protein
MGSFVVGLALCIPSSKRLLGKRLTLGAVACFAVLLGIAVAQSPTQANSPQIQVATTDNRSASQAPVGAMPNVIETKPANLSRGQILANFRIRGVSWSKEGFGMVMKASFLIHNDNPMPLKDIEVTCSSSANSGSTIDKNTRTIFDVVKQNSYLQVDNLNMGFIRSEINDTDCRVTGFSKA